MRVHVLKTKCKNGKLMLLLRVEIDMNSLYKHELGDLERKILELIVNKGEVTQRELSRVFGRANTCRAVQNLEKLGLIRRERNGRTYVIKVV
ncbi:helix-turn-helix transcriptional regulator [Thermococcus sp.]